ncbi:MAG: DUF4065 domain-containing protein [Chlamydiia bacterium]|nr:DUF4065 domain-containing protein [Chlamydiia bacterium]
MECLQCGGTQFQEQKVRFNPEVKGECVETVMDALVCEQCQTPMMDSKQMNGLRKAAADAYRKTHGLLTSGEIVHFRETLGMSQAAFAAYLNVGEASIKRWETYAVQDPSQDEHMRLKCDEAYAELNALQVQWKCRAPDIFNGNRRFSLEMMKHTILYLIRAAKSPLYLNKVLFYADFLHFKSFGKSLTGAQFVPLEYGPCPDQFQNIISCMEKQGLITKTGTHNFQPTQPADLTLFDDHEQQTLKTIYKLIRLDGGKHLYDLSHEEAGFKKTPPGKTISYTFAEDLLI